METAFTLSLAEWLAILQSRRHGGASMGLSP